MRLVSSLHLFFFLQDVEIKEEGTKHMLILYNVQMDMAGGIDFSAANAKSNAQLRVKGETLLLLLHPLHLFIHSLFNRIQKSSAFLKASQRLLIQKNT